MDEWIQCLCGKVYFLNRWRPEEVLIACGERMCRSRLTNIRHGVIYIDYGVSYG